MGRHPFKEEEKRIIQSRIIDATRNIITEEGLEDATTRKIATAVGMNSANLYRYFKDHDELLMFALMDLLQKYNEELISSLTAANELKLGNNNKYILIWDVFCRYAFLYPECFSHLFFGKHSKQLKIVIKAYYSIYPEKEYQIKGELENMLTDENIYNRNLSVLRKALENRAVEETVQLINELTVSYFHSLLNEKLQNKEICADLLRIRMIDACTYLLNTV